jgi:hypothetical protein
MMNFVAMHVLVRFFFVGSRRAGALSAAGGLPRLPFPEWTPYGEGMLRRIELPAAGFTAKSSRSYKYGKTAATVGGPITTATGLNKYTFTSNQGDESRRYIEESGISVRFSLIRREYCP